MLHYVRSDRFLVLAEPDGHEPGDQEYNQEGYREAICQRYRCSDDLTDEQVRSPVDQSGRTAHGLQCEYACGNGSPDPSESVYAEDIQRIVDPGFAPHEQYPEVAYGRAHRPYDYRR